MRLLIRRIASESLIKRAGNAWLLVVTACLHPAVQEKTEPPSSNTKNVSDGVATPSSTDPFTTTVSVRPHVPMSEPSKRVESDAGDRIITRGASAIDCSSSDICEHGGHCVDSQSGARCECEGTGFRGQYCDEDVDECAMDNGSCGLNAHFNNLPGARACACGETQTGDGVGPNGCQERMTKVNVYASGRAACALGVNQRVYCWGTGTNNAFGDDRDAERTEATEIAGLDDVMMLGQGDGEHACVVMRDKTV